MREEFRSISRKCLLADVGDKGGVWNKSPSVVVAGNVTSQTRSGGGAQGPI